MASHYTRWPAILYGHLRCRFGKNSLWLAGAGRLSVAVHFCPRRVSEFRYFVLFNIRGYRGTDCFCHRIVNILGWRGQARCSQSGTAAARRRVPKNILVKHPNQPCFAQPAPSRPDEGLRPRSTNHTINTETDKRLGTEGKGHPTGPHSLPPYWASKCPDRQTHPKPQRSIVSAKTAKMPYKGHYSNASLPAKF